MVPPIVTAIQANLGSISFIIIVTAWLIWFTITIRGLGKNLCAHENKVDDALVKITESRIELEREVQGMAKAIIALETKFQNQSERIRLIDQRDTEQYREGKESRKRSCERISELEKSMAAIRGSA